jgi:D-inositol-3-phosphate glycosyltransferase
MGRRREQEAGMHGRVEGGVDAADTRPSDRAGPVPGSVALLSVHTSPLAQPGIGDGGGMNVFVSALASHLRAQKIEVHVFTRASGADLPPTVIVDGGVHVHHVEAGPPTLRKDDLASHLCAFYLAVAAHPAIADVDLVHGHYWMSGWVGRKLAQRRAIPLVQRFHTLAHVKDAGRPVEEPPEPMLRVAAERRVVSAADAVLAATADEAATLRRAYRAQPGQVRVVPPGVNTATFTPDGDRLVTRQELGGGRLLLFAGRLQPLKCPDMAVRTLAALDRHLPDDGIPTRLLIVGGASGNGHGTVDPPALRRLADELGVGDRVAVLAPRPHHELAPLYRAADVVVMPSRSESFGLVALEGAACGTPVVASAVGGLLTLVDHGHSGFLVHGRDPEVFASYTDEILGNDRLAREMAHAAAARSQRYTWSLAAARLRRAYGDLTAGALVECT